MKNIDLHLSLNKTLFSCAIVRRNLNLAYSCFDICSSIGLRCLQDILCWNWRAVVCVCRSVADVPPIVSTCLHLFLVLHHLRLWLIQLWVRIVHETVLSWKFLLLIFIVVSSSSSYFFSLVPSDFSLDSVNFATFLAGLVFLFFFNKL